MPRHVRLAESETEMVFTFRKLSPFLLFLAPFALIWCAGAAIALTVLLTRSAAGGGPPVAILALPFLVGLVALVSVVAFLAFGRTELRCSRDSGSVFIGVGRMGRTRRFSLANVETVAQTDTMIHINGRRQRQISVVYGDGTSFCFGALLPDEVQAYFVRVIRSLRLIR